MGQCPVFTESILSRFDFLNMQDNGGGPSRSPGFLPRPSNKQQKIVDLENIVEKWAWDAYHWKKSRKMKKIKTEFINCKIDWKNVNFIFEDPVYHQRSIAAATQKLRDSQPRVIFRTIFSNDTEKPQQYSFKTERRTSSVARVCVSEGFSAGAEFQIGLKTPCEILESNAGFKTELSVAAEKEDQVEEELSWGVDSQVIVDRGQRTVAELVVTEEVTAFDFTMDIRIKGKILAVFTNMNDGGSLVRICEGFVTEVMRHEIENEGLRGFRIEKDGTVVATISGSCSFKYGIEQHVRITEERLTR